MFVRLRQSIVSLKIKLERNVGGKREGTRIRVTWFATRFTSLALIYIQLKNQLECFIEASGDRTTNFRPISALHSGA